MRIRVFKVEAGGLAVLVEATPGKGRPPCLLKGITPDNLVGKVFPVVAELRKPKGEPYSLPS